MIKFILRGITLPFLYFGSLIKALLRYFIFVPFMFSLYTLKHIWPVIIVVFIVSHISLSNVGFGILVIFFIIRLKKIYYDTKEFICFRFFVDWSHRKRLSNDINFYLSDKKRIKLEKKAIKEYDKNVDEFVGFEIVADVFKQA